MALNPGRGPVTKPRSLDEVDRGIIEALQRNGRASFRGVATEVGVAEATVRARYGRLVDDGILQVTGVTNPMGLGFDAMALIGVNTTGSPEPVADELSSWEESSYVVVTAGRYDVLLEVVCVDRHHLLELTSRARAIEGVVSTETFLYLQLAKQVFAWGTRNGEEAEAT
ncbi:Lrp/AsnC family transcriptional regulator [Gaiella sp.]|uniref:Lrp/AsnC family transcriptional regulator n=1 Tax=Gaiella sp. TaxID=2663207 RepID=UPI002E36D272|nr:Lrp/AsnC family transcriptional regulator [Gaiella sp.]HEX5583043.1 Lrp/AsnC family transcriptional regulator [Gaiella sp.]